MEEESGERGQEKKVFTGADVAIAQLPRGDTPSDEKCGPFLGRC